VSEFDAAGVPAPAASSVECCSHLANQQASASHNGIIVSSAFLAPAPRPDIETRPVRIGDCRDVSSVLTVINDSCSPMYS